MSSVIDTIGCQSSQDTLQKTNRNNPVYHAYLHIDAASLLQFAARGGDQLQKLIGVIKGANVVDHGELLLWAASDQLDHGQDGIIQLLDLTMKKTGSDMVAKVRRPRPGACISTKGTACAK